LSGDDSGGEPPVPIPNTEVKPSSADGTKGETPWESRTLPGTKKQLIMSCFFCCFLHAAREVSSYVRWICDKVSMSRCSVKIG
jgi:hypothetical protein